MGASYLTMRGEKHVPKTDDRSAMMIARSTIDSAGSAAKVARRHLLRGQFRIPEPMRLEMQS